MNEETLKSRERYISVAKSIALSYRYTISQHIIDVAISVMMHRDKLQTGGSFVESICNNDLDMACSRADDECINYLRYFTLVKRFGYLN